MSARRLAFRLGFLSFCTFAGAALGASDDAIPLEARSADLPPYASVVRAMAAFPSIDAARANVRAQDAARTALRAGPYEYAMRLEGAERRDVGMDARFHEWNAILERPIRWAGKARLDERIGEEGVAAAASATGDAIHEAARTLLRQWFAWMRATATGSVWSAQLEVLKLERDIVERRVRLGDAPRQESLLAQAATAQADYAYQQARSRELAARAELQASFPGIAPAAAPAALDPRAVDRDLDAWREAILEHSHELALARAEVRRRRAAAARADADRTPDPTVGIRYGSERGHNDRIVGLFFSLPLPGAARAARASEAAANIDVASAREAALVRRLTAEASSLYATATAAYAGAARAADAAEGMRNNAALTSKAYALGEANLAEVLLARRNATDAALAATLARLEAAESRYRLLLDAHALWPLD